MNIAVITGASSGLGSEFARQLESYFIQIDEYWLIARRKDRLDELAGSLNKKCKIIQMDVTKEEEMVRLEELYAMEKPTIRVLINCAGFGMLGHFDESVLREQTGMIDLNCTALTKITYLSIPYMEKKSRMIQVASSAAFMPQPNFAVYAATKAYVLSFARALSEELRKKKIYVTAVCPGPIRTEFFDIAERNGASMAIKKIAMVEAPGVVKAALLASVKKQTMSVYSPFIKGFMIISKVVPHKLIMATMRSLK